ncbi:facilitated trehalose transporter Tret1-like [Drosophila hydei]|uniref:Facilitated trehalose transporter Tret1-like n=1 Tax=Drosophila hydei TaxID=7224 RepID=A0A6J1LLC7_DROHY|nr:facilitated trehalose transporter Tret1-like [Drosophila hydei]
MSSFWDRPGGQNQYIAAFFASLSVFTCGATIGWAAPAQIEVMEKKYYGFPVSLTEYAWTCALATLGCGLTVMPAGALANCVGRKVAMLLLMPPYLAGWALTIYPINLYLLMFSRLLQGLCSGFYAMITPIYCLEISQLEVKSYIVNFTMVFYLMGILYSYILGTVNDMLYLNCGCAVFPALFLLTFIWMPESPVYYVLKDKKMKAIRSLQWLRGTHMDVLREYDHIFKGIEQIRENSSYTCRKLKHKASIRAMLTCICLMGFKHLCGSVAILTYSTLILTDADSQIFLNVKVSTIFIGLSFLLSGIISLIDCAGHRILMIWSVVMVALNCTVQATYFQLKDNHEYAIQWLPIVNLCCFFFFFGLGVGVLPYVIMRKYFGENIDVMAYSIIWTFNCLFAFASALLFPYLLQIGNMSLCFWIFTAIAFLYLIFVYFFVPETKGKTYAEIKEMLNN